MEEDDDSYYPNHKLCGYLSTILSLPSPPPSPSLSFLSACHLFTDGNEFGFKSDNGVVLSPPNKNNVSDYHIKSRNGGVSSASRKRYKNKRGIGMVNGSLSVVDQIHALVVSKCIEVRPRVLKVVEEEPKYNVVVLVDVYLPIELWTGWQFPKSKSTAAALFRHLSCDWGKRSLMLVDGGDFRENYSTRCLMDCHVIGCQLNCSVLDSTKKRRFELHEIFTGLPSVTNRIKVYGSRVKPAGGSIYSGIWDLTDDILINILSVLDPMDLVRIAATCQHLRALAASVMPCTKLKLFPHQEAAVDWMLHREKNDPLLPHPLYISFVTEDGFKFYVNTVSGEVVTEIAPTVRDFHGGMFCDEPGLGKTITALSLILKTQGTIADPPDGVQITWCAYSGDQKRGYYELSSDDVTCNNTFMGRRVMCLSARRAQLLNPADDASYSSPKRPRLNYSGEGVVLFNESCPVTEMKPDSVPHLEPVPRVVRYTRSLSRVKKNLMHAYEEVVGSKKKVGKNLNKKKSAFNAPKFAPWDEHVDISGEDAADYSECNETWVQCDSCRKWRRLTDAVPDAAVAWFCSMNTDPEHKTCKDPEEDWDSCEPITHLPGFYPKGTSGGKEQNISFFISVLKEHYSMINSKTKKALTWLATLSSERLFQMETVGLISPVLGSFSASGGASVVNKIFKAFGLTRRVEKDVSRWYYSWPLENLAFDVDALRIALCKPLNSVRLYLSRATLVVVPANLVDHWKTQIQKHIKPGQLRVCIWTDHKKPSPHSLAWDYDIVITTFNRLSAEWSPSKESPLMQVHWLRVMLDEGHTLGSSLNLTNKFQMAISLTASSRWLLTGTPTRNTPNSQLPHLQPMLKFLHEEAYGQNQKSWEAGILRPFEAEMEEGRSRLLELLRRCLISARKKDLKNIPPCIKKVTLLNFTEEHAKSYNELVVTVRRNILMADWNDPSHVESLLNPKQWKFRSATVRNVRLSCCVAGHVKVTDAGEDIQETMDALVEKGLDPNLQEYALIKYYLQYGGNCQRCKEWCRLPVITPCRHLLCLDCVGLDSEKCTLPGCGSFYVMQTPDNLTRPENPNPKWPVPKDLIELQPSYKQDDWNPDWQSTSSSKVSYLVERMKVLQEANNKSGHSNKENEYNNNHSWIGDSALLQDYTIRSSEACKRALQKVLIFSQFLEHIHVIEQQLTFAGIKFAGLYSPMHSSNKMKSLDVFKHDATCLALLMDGSAALGLDLSFVTHVFLMEPIWDRSMEEQVISRAHRMGATCPVLVETLAMCGTIEEQMLEFLQDPDECRELLKEESNLPDSKVPRPRHSLHDFAEHNYLARLSFVHRSSSA
ncbi:F-box protein At3g54460 [Mercurialis annua]|uniref:F-box protein At3g54460 n=1 Tax=Mercurialis annua TaxID=3986 RepID=UPI00215F3DC2|nr:F-box protein At3g54460 [Mercurialis annua]